MKVRTHTIADDQLDVSAYAQGNIVFFVKVAPFMHVSKLNIPKEYLDELIEALEDIREFYEELEGDSHED